MLLNNLIQLFNINPLYIKIILFYNEYKSPINEYIFIYKLSSSHISKLIVKNSFIFLNYSVISENGNVFSIFLNSINPYK